MALITRFLKQPAANASFGTEVECGWRAVDSGDRRLLHLETYGSGQRAIPGKVSQSLQLDAKAAKELVEIIRRTFPELR